MKRVLETEAVGGAVLKYDRPRPSCQSVEALTRRGMMFALAQGRGGICARVVASGTMRENDSIEVL